MGLDVLKYKLSKTTGGIVKPKVTKKKKVVKKDSKKVKTVKKKKVVKKPSLLDKI
jgi:hypothetical protein